MCGLGQLAQDTIQLLEFCKYGNEHLCSINGELLNKLRVRRTLLCGVALSSFNVRVGQEKKSLCAHNFIMKKPVLIAIISGESVAE